MSNKSSEVLVPQLKLREAEKKRLLEGATLTDRHVNGTPLLLGEQFPDIPCPRSHTPYHKIGKIKTAQDRLLFFHNFCEHWALSHIKDNIVYLYDKLQLKCIHPNLGIKPQALYGNQTVKIPYVQIQKGSKDCGCFAIAFCISLMFGDDPATLCYDQKK